MSIEAPIQNVLLKILQLGLLRIRMLGNRGRGDICQLEADHLHNLPSVLMHSSTEELLYYYNIEIPAFRRSLEYNMITEVDADEFNGLWSELGSLISLHDSSS
jgi:hypothetical protein